MGKKKSVALTIVFTVIIAFLIAMCVVPSFTLPFSVNGSIKEYNSVLNVISYDSQLGGGYYSIFYPEGVIPQDEYEAEYEAKKAVSEKSAEEYAAKYTKHGALYLEDDIVENGDADESFKEDFNRMVRVVSARFEAMELKYLRVDIVDDYALRIEVSNEVTSPDTVFGVLSASGDFTIAHSSRSLPYFPANRHSMGYFISSVTYAESGGSPYVKINFTSDGRTLFKSVSSIISSDEDDTNINFNVGGTTVVSFSLDSSIDQDYLYISGYTDTKAAKAVAVLFNSCLNEDDIIDFGINAATTRTVSSSMGDEAITLVYVAFGAVILFLAVFSVIKYRGLGVANIYGFLSYLIIVIMIIGLVGYISVSAGAILAIMLALILTSGSNFYMFGCIRKEFESGKRVESAVKDGYKKAILPLVDIYVVLIASAIFMIFVGTAALSVFAQTLVFALISAAASSILLTRFYVAMLMGTAKDKFKFCKFAREVDDDED